MTVGNRFLKKSFWPQNGVFHPKLYPKPHTPFSQNSIYRFFWNFVQWYLKDLERTLFGLKMGNLYHTLAQQPCTPCWNPHWGYFCSFALLLGTVSSQSDNSEYKLFWMQNGTFLLQIGPKTLYTFLWECSLKIFFEILKEDGYCK